MIEVRNLSKFYGRIAAVRDVSFTIKEGEIVGFLGPNGAGKTTTIRALTCYHPATSGEARVAGFDVFADSMRVRENVGYLPESVPLYTEMRVREYLQFRGRLRGMDRSERKQAVARVAKRCWIEDVINRPINQLSKGYRQRVGLADALMHSPKVLILDEPTVGLDPTQIRETRKLIRSLGEEHTVMLSSHILPEVEATCQRLIVINEGSIVASGTPDELRQKIAGDAPIMIELRASEADVRGALAAHKGVSDIALTRHGEWTHARVSAPSDLREEFFKMACEKSWSVRELRRDAPSLEDFFVKIVAGAGTK